MDQQDLIDELDPDKIRCDYCRKIDIKGNICQVSRRSSMAIQSKFLCMKCRRLDIHSGYSLSLQWVYANGLDVMKCSISHYTKEEYDQTRSNR